MLAPWNLGFRPLTESTIKFLEKQRKRPAEELREGHLRLCMKHGISPLQPVIFDEHDRPIFIPGVMGL